MPIRVNRQVPAFALAAASKSMMNPVGITVFNLSNALITDNGALVELNNQ